MEGPSLTWVTFHLLTRIHPEGKLSCSTPKGKKFTLGNLASETQLFLFDCASSRHTERFLFATFSCGTQPMLNVLKPWCSSQLLSLDNRVNHLKGTHMHKHIRDWVSDQPPLKRWDFPEHLLAIGAGPFASTDRRLIALWSPLTWKMCHWESTEDFLLPFLGK